MIKFILIYVISISSYAGWFSNPAYNPDGEFYDYGWALPEPNDIRREGLPTASDTSLKHYFDRQLHWSEENREKLASNGSVTPYVFESELQGFKAVDDDLNETGLVSYLFYEDGKIKVDKKSPDSRFGSMFDDDSQLLSNSLGKTVSSYVLGHAICDGYISGVNERIDWPLLKNTLYYDQTLTDMINFRAGDSKYMTQRDGLVGLGNVMSQSVYEISDFVYKTEPSTRNFNYSSLLPKIIINYVQYKVGSEDDFQHFLDNIFQKKIGIENEVWFVKAKKSWKKDYEDGLATTHFFATRYDYLRIAKAMLDDWNNNTCVGQYLKDIYANKEYKGSEHLKSKTKDYPTGATNSYGGFFHADYYGYWGNPNIMIMDGYGGQMIWINFDDNRIVVAHAVHSTYDWKNIVADVVKNGLNHQ